MRSRWSNVVFPALSKPSIKMVPCFSDRPRDASREERREESQERIPLILLGLGYEQALEYTVWGRAAARTRTGATTKY